MLTANEFYIFDHYEGIKYFWDDVEEVIATDDLLYVHLYEPAKYLNKIRSPFYKFIMKIKYKLFKIKPSYIISMDLLDIKKGDNKKFLEELNDYSINALK